MNNSSDSIVSVYSDARAEYTKQLCVFLVPAYFQFYIELLEKSKKDMINEPKRSLWQFQNYLNEIHDWNMEKVNTEIGKINNNSGCDYIEDLITAVFIAHTKVLTAIRLSSNKKRIEINVPKVEHFLFKVLCEISKLLWSSTYLFRDGIPGIERQQNYKQIEQIINEGILQAVRSLVPVKSILRDFINGDINGGDTGGDVTKGDDNDDSDDENTDNATNTANTAKKSEEHVTTAHVDESKNEHKSSEDTDKTPIVNDIPVMNPAELSSEAVTTATAAKSATTATTAATNTQQTIVLDDKPSVHFGDFDTIFDSDNPHDSEMVYDPKEHHGEDIIPVLEISEEPGTNLVNGQDFEDLDKLSDQPENLKIDDYEVLQ